MLTKNVGTADRVIRIVVSLGLAFGAYNSAGVLAIVLWVLAAVVMATALIGWCWLYALLGLSTCGDCKTSSPAAPPGNKPD